MISAPICGLGLYHIQAFKRGPKRTQKGHKIDIFRIMAIRDPLFNGTGWNEVRTALKLSWLIILAHFTDQECPKLPLSLTNQPSVYAIVDHNRK